MERAGEGSGVFRMDTEAQGRLSRKPFFAEEVELVRTGKVWRRSWGLGAVT